LFASVKFLYDNHVKNSTYLSETATKRNNLSQKTDPPLNHSLNGYIIKYLNGFSAVQ